MFASIDTQLCEELRASKRAMTALVAKRTALTDGREDELFREAKMRQFRGGFEMVRSVEAGTRGSFRVTMSDDVIFGSRVA